MFSIPTGMMPEEKAHRLAFANRRKVAADAYGRAFPERQKFAALPMAMQREAALLARESGCHDAFCPSSGQLAENLIAWRGPPVVAIHSEHSQEAQAEGVAVKLDALRAETDLLIERLTVSAPGQFIIAVDLYRRALALGIEPDCSERFFSQVLQKSHDAAQRQIPGRNMRLVCLLNRCFK